MIGPRTLSLIVLGVAVYFLVKHWGAPKPDDGPEARDAEGRPKAPPEAEPPLLNAKLVKAFDSTYPAEAHLVKTLLESSDIPCTIFDEGVVTVNPLYSFVVGGVKVMVPEDRLEEARPIIEAYLRDNPERSDETTDEGREVE